jgi:hypothetical protein
LTRSGTNIAGSIDLSDSAEDHNAWPFTNGQQENSLDQLGLFCTTGCVGAHARPHSFRTAFGIGFLSEELRRFFRPQKYLNIPAHASYLQSISRPTNGRGCPRMVSLWGNHPVHWIQR